MVSKGVSQRYYNVPIGLSALDANQRPHQLKLNLRYYARLSVCWFDHENRSVLKNIKNLILNYHNLITF